MDRNSIHRGDFTKWRLMKFNFPLSQVSIINNHQVNFLNGNKNVVYGTIKMINQSLPITKA